jgi:hypothetical protein
LVGTGLSVKPVIAIAPVQLVIANPAVKGVIANAPSQLVRTSGAQEHIVTLFAVQPVIIRALHFAFLFFSFLTSLFVY